MSEILNGLKEAESNIKDILIYGSTQLEQDQRLHAVLHRLSSARHTKFRQVSSDITHPEWYFTRSR